LGKRLRKRNRNTEQWWMGKVRPLDVGERLKLVPFWERGLAVSDRTPLIIDPGPSFGTGDHPTTIMALELLEEAVNEASQTGCEPTLLDVGTGTGVLAIAGKILGTGFTLGLDIDSASVFTARRNVDLNGLVLSGRSSVTCSTLVSRQGTWKETSPGTEARATASVGADLCVHPGRTRRCAPTSWDGRPCPSTSGHCPGEGSRGGVDLVVGGVDCVRGLFQIVTVNLVAPVLLRLKKDLTDRVGDTLILSGIADVMADEVIAAFGSDDLSVSKIKSREGWNAAVFHADSAGGNGFNEA